MNTIRAALATAFLATILILLAPGAAATTNQIACAATGYAQTGGATAWWWATTDTMTDATTCVPESASVTHAGSSSDEGTCTSVTIRAGSAGTPTGGTPTAIHLYVYADHDVTTHTSTFAGYLANINVGTSLPATVNVCRTMDATPAGASAPGNYRLVLRVCNYIGGSGCAGGTRAYDVWSDGGGTPPTGGSAYSNERSGVLVARAFMYCARDSANGVLGPDTSTYVPGGTPTLAVCTHTFNTNTYSLIASVWNGGGGFGASVNGNGAASSGNPLTATFLKVTAKEPDNSCSCAWANGATYTLNVTWTDGGTLGCYNCIPEGVVGWSNTTAGTLNAGHAVHDAPFGRIDKTLTATCVPRDPLSGAASLVPAKLARGEQLQCRGAGAGGLAEIRNARNEPWPSGASLSVYARRESQPPEDATDAPRCDATTTSDGVYQCDATLRVSTYTNNAIIGGATATTSLGYGADVAIYQESARTTLLARAHVANLFDVTPTHTFATAAGACNRAPLASVPIAQRGDAQTLSFKLCNPRGEIITPTGTTDVTRQDTFVVDQGPSVLAPTSGIYSWTFTANGASQHSLAGYAKRLNFSDGQGNNASADDAYNVTDLLQVGAFHTWLKTCTGPESMLFVAAADTICANEGPVTSATNAPWTLPKTFLRWYNNTADNAQLPSETVTGVTTTTSSNHQVTPQPPAGSWTFTVRVYDANANYGEASRVITIVSPLTSIYDILCTGTNIRIEPGGTMTIICTTMKRDPTTYILQAYCPDAPPYYRVNASTSDGQWTTVVPTTTPDADTATPCSYWINWTVPANWPDGQAAELLVQANMSGAPIHAYYPLNIETTKGADPVFATAEYSWDTHAVTIGVSLKFGNGTARSGIASQLHGTLYAPDDTTASGDIAFAERGSTGTYYSRPNLGTSPARGTWLVVLTAPQPTGNAFTNFTTTFTVSENLTLAFLDQRQVALDMWTSLNATLDEIKTLVREHAAEANDSFAYTWRLLNETIASTPATLQINITSDAAGSGIYAGRATRLEATAGANGTGAFRAWFWTWDLDDNSTNIGSIVYHAWTKPGNYTIRATATSALGDATTLSETLRVNLSTPTTHIDGPANVTVGEPVTWTIGATSDPHDDLVATNWEVDPTDVDVWLLGPQHVNKGWCTNCASYTTVFLAPGDHDIIMRARNAHDVTNTTTLHVHVESVVQAVQDGTHAPAPIGRDDLAHANEKARGFVDGVHRFIHWLTGA